MHFELNRIEEYIENMVYMKEAFALKRTYALTPLIIYPLLYTRRK